MSSFVYFAYGSNMLTARLRERCPSATRLGTGWANGYCVAFSKEGRDGSGKATLREDRRETACVHGVLYRVAEVEREALDRAEARYDRFDAFAIHAEWSESPVPATVYIASPDACRDDLSPFDWYVALIEAGARQHGLAPAYIRQLCCIESKEDADMARAALMKKLANTQ